MRWVQRTKCAVPRTLTIPPLAPCARSSSPLSPVQRRVDEGGGFGADVGRGAAQAVHGPEMVQSLFLALERTVLGPSLPQETE